MCARARFRYRGVSSVLGESRRVPRCGWRGRSRRRHPEKTRFAGGRCRANAARAGTGFHRSEGSAFPADAAGPVGRLHHSIDRPGQRHAVCLRATRQECEARGSPRRRDGLRLPVQDREERRDLLGRRLRAGRHHGFLARLHLLSPRHDVCGRQWRYPAFTGRWPGVRQRYVLPEGLQMAQLKRCP